MQMRKILVAVLGLAFVFGFFVSAYCQQFRADGNKAKSYIEYLASDQLEGRQTLTPGYQKATEWVAARFKEWGLKPCGDGGTSYFQKVPIGRPVTVNAGIPSLNVGTRVFSFDDADFTVNSLSTAKTAVKADVIFAGYGISLPAKGLDEYAGLNVQGKVVLVFKGNPESFAQPRGIFTETTGKTPAPIGLTPEEVTDNAKIKNAYDKGAAAILLYSPDPAQVPLGGRMFFGPGGQQQTSTLEIKRNQDPDVIAVVKPSTGGPGGSDHSTFITKGIVSMALMTGGGGGHPDYHDSGDDAVKIDPEIMRKVSRFVVQGTMNLADETTVNLIVPDRLYLYNSLMMRVTNINTALPELARRLSPRTTAGPDPSPSPWLLGIKFG